MKKIQNIFITTLTSITLLALAFIILAISFFSANRRQAGKINQLTPGVIKSYPLN